jgi:Protein of unknown function (DUF3159)
MANQRALFVSQCERYEASDHNVIGILTDSQPALDTFDDMADGDTPEPLSNKDLKGLAKTMLARQGGIMGVVAAVATTSVFFVVSTLSSMQPALITAVAAAILALGLQLIRRQALRQAIAGFVIVGASASVAAFTGQAKGFFLIGTLGTGAASVCCSRQCWQAGRWPAGYSIELPVAGRTGARIAGRCASIQRSP